jgi:chemotaxis regulatin CheY-phosphate phosphatase CheZ
MHVEEKEQMSTNPNRQESQIMETASVQQSVDNADVGMIKDFIEHVRSIVPLLEHVKNSMEESSSKIPKASKQLNDVTSATESATVEILNVLEAMTARIGDTEKELAVVREFVCRNNGTTESGPAINSVDTIERMLAETKDNSMNIAIALQVQDITSQQIAGVAHTIESIRQALGKALKRFDAPDDPASTQGEDCREEGKEGAAVHFDGDARFSTTPDRQDLADEVIKQWNQKSLK